ncbi:MAG: 2-amino-4-hydroxy-6-hydroxymethyldihydropteridine diphosphokinase [Porphyromonadaceae bacterium]|nr:MAG: 2-amino-4-hydroxy-6-hydroxymethyldihydropteridine diphosphokinase [Porphyromonadaceae bacterium]
MQELIIGLGSNLGDRRKNIETAIALIGERIGLVTAESTFVETEPWGFESENKFLNCAIIVGVESCSSGSYSSSAAGIIGILQSIEYGFGRVRTGVYTDRAIDLDILFYGDEIINEPGLIVPHPKLHERDFILISLMELCPEKVHPVIGKSIRELWGDQKYLPQSQVPPPTPSL